MCGTSRRLAASVVTGGRVAEEWRKRGEYRTPSGFWMHHCLRGAIEFVKEDPCPYCLRRMKDVAMPLDGVKRPRLDEESE